MSQSRVIVYGNDIGALAAAWEAVRTGAVTCLVLRADCQPLTQVPLPDPEKAATPGERYLACRLTDTLGFLQKLLPEAVTAGDAFLPGCDLNALLLQKCREAGVQICDIIDPDIAADYLVYGGGSDLPTAHPTADYNRRLTGEDGLPLSHRYYCADSNPYAALVYGRIAGAHAGLTALGLPSGKTYLRRRLRSFRHRPAFVRTTEQAKEILQAGSGVFSNMTVFGFLYRTTKEFAKSVLPAPFEVDNDPQVGLYVCDSDTYAGFVAQLTCLYDGHPTKYALGYVMESDTSTMYGQTFLGEPKKVGDIWLDLDGHTVRSKVVRHGEVVCEMQAELSDLTPLGTQEKPALAYDFPTCMFYRYHFKPDGSGIENLQLIGMREADAMQEKAVVSNGKLVLHETTDDAYGQIPLTELVHGAYITFDQYITGDVFPSDMTCEDFLPYALYKHDDYTEMGTLGDYVFYTPNGLKK